VAAGEFFHCRRAVRLDYPQSLTCLAVGVGSVAEGFDARCGPAITVILDWPNPVGGRASM
jgi:hypothetical protein